jgi:hypothetical protein
MRPRRRPQGQFIASGVILALLVLEPFTCAQESVSPETTSNPSPVGAPASAPPDVARPPAAATRASGSQLPDSPGSVQSRPMASPQSDSANSMATQVPTPAPQSNDRAQAEEPAPSPDPQPSAQSPPPPRTLQEPRGTAAAESVPTTGIAASRPAGAAIAPAKQRRVRSLLIKVGVVVGAGIAAGTTLALSKASPSKPPGSH